MTIRANDPEIVKFVVPMISVNVVQFQRNWKAHPFCVLATLTFSSLNAFTDHSFFKVVRCDFWAILFEKVFKRPFRAKTPTLIPSLSGKVTKIYSRTDSPHLEMRLVP